MILDAFEGLIDEEVKYLDGVVCLVSPLDGCAGLGYEVMSSEHVSLVP